MNKLIIQDKTYGNIETSIIIPTNRIDKDFFNLLESIKISYDSWNIEIIEVIILINNVSIPKGFGIYIDIPVKVVDLGIQKSLAHIRNYGFKIAKGKKIILTDSDCIVSETWLCKMSQGLDKYSCIVGGFDQSICSIECRICSIEQSIDSERTDRYNKLGYCIADFRNFGIKIPIPLQLDERFKHAACEDIDFGIRLNNIGVKIHFIADAIVKHSYLCNYFKALRRKGRHGFYYGLLYQKHSSFFLKFWKRTPYSDFKRYLRKPFASSLSTSNKLIWLSLNMFFYISMLLGILIPFRYDESC